MTIVVLGAAGKTGRAVVTALAARGRTVLGVIRRPEQARAVIRAGADNVLVADLAAPDTVRSAWRGASAVYLMAPNVHADEPGLLAPLIEMTEQTDGPRLVYHSVMHPWAPSMPHHRDKAAVEAALHNSTADWTVLQPSSYMENIGDVAAVAAAGRWSVPYSVEALFSPIALPDLAEVAARVLVEAGHRYATYELAGPQLLSIERMAGELGAVAGTEVLAVRDREAWEQGVGIGAPTESVDRLRAMFDHYDRHGFVGGSRVLGHLLGRAPTPWAHWCAERVGRPAVVHTRAGPTTPGARRPS